MKIIFENDILLFENLQITVTNELNYFRKMKMKMFIRKNIKYLYTYKTLVTLIDWLDDCLRPCVRILDTELLL